MLLNDKPLVGFVRPEHLVEYGLDPLGAGELLAGGGAHLEVEVLDDPNEVRPRDGVVRALLLEVAHREGCSTGGEAGEVSIVRVGTGIEHTARTRRSAGRPGYNQEAQPMRASTAAECEGGDGPVSTAKESFSMDDRSMVLRLL